MRSINRQVLMEINYLVERIPFSPHPDVRMAERSKAPDSRFKYLPIAQWERAFWSLNGGVGSNPTPDKCIFYILLTSL